MLRALATIVSISRPRRRSFFPRYSKSSASQLLFALFWSAIKSCSISKFAGISNSPHFQRVVELSQKTVLQSAVHRDNVPGRFSEPFRKQKKYCFRLIGRFDRRLSQRTLRIKI